MPDSNGEARTGLARLEERLAGCQRLATEHLQAHENRFINLEHNIREITSRVSSLETNEKVGAVRIDAKTKIQLALITTGASLLTVLVGTLLHAWLVG